MMDELDADEKVLRDIDGNAAKRDLVQFVKLKEAIARGNLSEEVLKEIPSQLCRYMEMIKFNCDVAKKGIPMDEIKNAIDNDVQR